MMIKIIEPMEMKIMQLIRKYSVKLQKKQWMKR